MSTMKLVVVRYRRNLIVWNVKMTDSRWSRSCSNNQRRIVLLCTITAAAVDVDWNMTILR